MRKIKLGLCFVLSKLGLGCIIALLFLIPMILANDLDPYSGNSFECVTGYSDYNYCDSFGDSSLNISLFTVVDDTGHTYSEGAGYLNQWGETTFDTGDFIYSNYALDTSTSWSHIITYQINKSSASDWVGYSLDASLTWGPDRFFNAIQLNPPPTFYLWGVTSGKEAKLGTNYTFISNATNGVGRTILYENNTNVANYTGTYTPANHYYVLWGMSADVSIIVYYLASWNGTPEDAPYLVAPPLTNLTINITTPSEDEHLNSDFYINVSGNTTMACSINESDWVLNWNNNTLFSFINSSTPLDGYYSININCTNTTGGQKTEAIRNFYIDTTDPIISPKPELLNNKTIVWNGTLSTYINFSDNIEIYSVNITIYNGTQIYGVSNFGASFLEVNISYGVDPTPNGSITARVCDTHTAQEIQPVKVEYNKKGLRYVMRETWGFNNEWIHIYPKEYGDYNNPETEKLRDRYTFTFNKKGIAGTEVFIIESSNFIDIIKNKKYGGHVVIPGLNYWVDFESNQTLGYNVKRISDNKIEVRVSGLIGSSFLFNSIGELNCKTERYYYINVNPVSSFIGKTLEGDSNNFNLNVSETNLITNINTTLDYNGVQTLAGTSSNFSRIETAPTLTTPLYSNVSFNWILGVNGETINLTNTINYQLVYNRFLNNCSNVSINTTALSIQILNLTTGAPQSAEVILSIDGDLILYDTYTSLNNFSLCVYPWFSNYSESVAIQYGSIGNYNYYNVDLYFDNVTDYLTLYLQDNPQETTFTVKNKETNELLENVYSTMYRLVNGSWIIIEAKYTDVTGRVKFSYVENVKYRFFLSRSTYASKVFYLDPVLFSEYDILMDPNVTLNIAQDYDRVALVYYPQIFYNSQTNNFTFLISSPYGELITYGYNATYPGGSSVNSGTAGIGESLTSVFNITGATVLDQVRLYFYYNTNISGTRNFTHYLDIVLNESANTMMGGDDPTYGMGIFERVLIMVLAVILIVGIASLVGQPIPGLAIGIGFFCYCVYIKFVPLWSVLISIALALLIIGSRPEG